MQLPRLIIGAVFFVLAALLAVPMVIDWFSPDADVSTAATTSTSPSPSGTTASASPSPSGSESPTRSASPSRTASPAQPVTAVIGSRVACPARTVQVMIRNTGSRTEDFGIEKNDDTAAIPGEIPANSTRTVTVRLREDRATRITVNWANKRVGSATVRANCEKAGAAPTTKPPEQLPHTGPNDVLWARGATAVAVLIMGGIFFWYGGIWPRRKEKVFEKK